MSLESALLGGVFDIDNWAKYKMVCDLNYPAVTSEYDIVYSDTDPAVCKADLHYNKDSKKWAKYPVVVNIHGGGWIIGDKKNSTGMSLQMADGGAFVMNINYGMPPKSQPFFEKNDPKVCHSSKYLWPAQLPEIFLALKWVEDNAEKYNLDLDNVFVSGDSAGSHLASVTETANYNDEYAAALGVTTKLSYKLKGALLFCGFYDLDTFYGLNMNKVPVARSMMQDLTGLKDPTQHPAYKLVNPIPYMTKEMPRTLIISGMLDVMTHGQSDLVEKKMKELGVDHVRYNSKGVPFSIHDYQILAFSNESHKCMRFASKFIDETVSMPRK